MLNKFIFCRRHRINIGIYVCFAAFLIVAAMGFVHLVLNLAGFGEAFFGRKTVDSVC